MEKSKRRSEEERVRLVSEQRSSGKTQKTWCAEHGINLRMFRDWLNRSKRGEFDNQNRVDWVEAGEENMPAVAGSIPVPTIEVEIGSYTVKVMPGFDLGTFSSVCRTLGKLC
jgi:hypothetical protein